MPEHIRALIVILFFSLPVLWFARQPLCEGQITDEADYARDQKAWIVLTLFAFLSHNFWLFIILTGAYLAKVRKEIENPLAFYCLLLLALPTEYREIPGVGPIDQIITVDYYRLLSFALLLPAAIHLYRTRATRTGVPRSIDFFVCALMIWMTLKHAFNDGFIHVVRGFVFLMLDMGIPYYVASRGLSGLRDYRRLAGAIILGSVIVGILAVFESARNWLLYSSLPQAWGFPEGYTPYVLRGEGGPLRAKVSLGNPIVLGYVFIVAIGMFVFVRERLLPKWKRHVALLCLIAGLIASLSRGPWVGTAATCLALFALGPGLGKRLAWGIFGGGTLVLLLLISPWGDTVIAYLPFVGTVEKGSVDYRTRLFDVSMIVFKQNPLLGDFHYLRNPIMEQMRQGQGIIDMVNTYLQVALPFGVLGLIAFAGCFLAGLKAVRSVHRKVFEDPEVELLGRVLIGILVGILVTIATVSSVGVISMFYWTMLGLSAGYVRIFAPVRVPHARRAAAKTSRSNARRVGARSSSST